MKKSALEFKFPNTVGIIYSYVLPEYFPTREQYLTEKNAESDAKVISSYIEKLGVKVLLFPANASLSSELRKTNPDMVINLADSVKGIESLSSAVPGIIEMLGIPYTGTDILGKALDTNKFLVKKLLQQSGVPVPNFQMFINGNELLDSNLRFPLISKLNEIHGGVEISKDSISENEKHLRNRLKYLITTYKQPVIVEEFIVGKEITGILLEGLNKKVYLAEKVFKNAHEKFNLVTFENVWIKEKADKSYFYQKFEDPLLDEYIRKAFEITKMFDYGKFDIRLDSSGRYFFIDSNANSAFGPKELDCAISNILDMYGVSFTEILKRLILNTMRDASGKKKLPI